MEDEIIPNMQPGNENMAPPSMSDFLQNLIKNISGQKANEPSV